jgi:hypothetical protein
MITQQTLNQQAQQTLTQQTLTQQAPHLQMGDDHIEQAVAPDAPRVHLLQPLLAQHALENLHIQQQFNYISHHTIHHTSLYIFVTYSRHV